MTVSEVARSLLVALMEYRGEKTRHFKQKNEIVRQLLLAIIETNIKIQNTHQSWGEMAFLYNKLIASHTALKQLKNNQEGLLNSIVNTHINKFKADKLSPILLIINDTF